MLGRMVTAALADVVQAVALCRQRPTGGAFGRFERPLPEEPTAMNRLFRSLSLPTAVCLGAVWLAASAPAAAYSSGATVCEVERLPFAPMASVLRDPPPSGWQLLSDGGLWFPSAIRWLRLQHPDPERRARGLLLWVKGSPAGLPSGAGRFLDLGLSEHYQRVPLAPPSDCGEWALTQRDASGKTQAELQFVWQAPSVAGWGSLIARAFVIEDCGSAQGGCRDAQALTDFLILREAPFADGFE